MTNSLTVVAKLFSNSDILSRCKSYSHFFSKRKTKHINVFAISQERNFNVS